MAGSGHGTASAVPTAGRFSLLSVFPEPDDDPCDQADQNQADEDRSGIIHDCLQHKLTLSALVSWLPDTF